MINDDDICKYLDSYYVATRHAGCPKKPSPPRPPSPPRDQQPLLRADRQQ